MYCNASQGPVPSCVTRSFCSVYVGRALMKTTCEGCVSISQTPKGLSVARGSRKVRIHKKLQSRGNSGSI